MNVLSMQRSYDTEAEDTDLDIVGMAEASNRCLQLLGT